MKKTLPFLISTPAPLSRLCNNKVTTSKPLLFTPHGGIYTKNRLNMLNPDKKFNNYLIYQVF